MAVIVSFFYFFMGVPAFYRWLSEKYPKCIKLVEEDGAPSVEGVYQHSLVDIEYANPNGVEFDNLYIDMNGIIHPCAHPENEEQPATEEHMFLNVMRYVDRLVAAVRPRRLLYLAIDGVAPRAKMNQQRSRRFRSAQEASEQKEVTADAREYMRAMGHKVPEEKEMWDSNVITPGTKFMTRLAKYLRFYIRERINTCPGWKKFKVILSDASVPGEGEHKIMSFIRQQRTAPDYDPNQRHILHGLDADLIMLALATHEAHFTILREEVVFGRRNKEEQKEQAELQRRRILSGLPPTQKPLQFLFINVLREYLKIDFKQLESTVPFGYEFERVVDDFVFLCFFVGNDFLPHLPSLDIRDGAIDFLLIIYKQILPSLGGYLTNAGEVDLSRVDVILGKVGQVENEIFRRRRIKEERDKVRRNQKKERMQRGGRDRIAAAAAIQDAQAVTRRDNVAAAAQLKASMKESTSTPVVDPMEAAKYSMLPPEEAIKQRVKDKTTEKLDKYSEEIKDTVQLGLEGWKDRYYSDKYKSEDIAHGGGREKVYQAYIEGLCWVMQYYYCGCASWEWFYPFHYAPFASDLVNIDRFEIKFELGEPFRPFEQLMGVFPAASSHAIPKPYRYLMSETESPIIDFYPTQIPVDPNGKPMPWLWVVLLPFIDQDRLLSAMKPLNEELSPSEAKRNRRFGDEILFFHTSNTAAECSSILGPNAEQQVELDGKLTQSLNGKISYKKEIYFEIGSLVPAPKKPDGVLQDIANNQSLSFIYEIPAVKPHVCRLLDGTIESATVLSESDQNVKIPRMGFGISIIDLANGAPARQQHKRSHDDMRQHQPREYNQYLADGYRGWGSMEPRSNPKRRHQDQRDQYGRRGGQDYRGGRGQDQQQRRSGGGGNRQYNDRRPQGGRDQYGRDQRPQGGRDQYGRDQRPPRGGGGGGFQPGSSFGAQATAAGGPPSLDSLRAGLMSMHQNRGTYNNGRDEDRRRHH